MKQPPRGLWLVEEGCRRLCYDRPERVAQRLCRPTSIYEPGDFEYTEEVDGGDRTYRRRYYPLTRSVRLLLRRGHTVEELLAVVSWARRAYDTGEARLVDHLMLAYLWSPSHFPRVLARMRESERRAGRRGGAAAPFLTLDAQERWERETLRKIKERGLDTNT